MERVEMVVCRSCGREVRADDRFCPWCGQTLADSSSVQTAKRFWGPAGVTVLVVLGGLALFCAFGGLFGFTTSEDSRSRVRLQEPVRPVPTPMIPAPQRTTIPLRPKPKPTQAALSGHASFDVLALTVTLTNWNDYDWQNVELVLNGTYRQSVALVPRRQEVLLLVRDFANDNGQRFDVASLKPLKLNVIATGPVRVETGRITLK